MKRIERYLSILLILCIMVCAVSMFTVSAVSVDDVDPVVVEAENLGNENELQPVMASGCGSQSYQYNNLTSLFNGLGISYTGSSHPYTLQGGYTYNMAPGGSHDYQNVTVYKNGNYVGMYTCLHG